MNSLRFSSACFGAFLTLAAIPSWGHDGHTPAQSTTPAATANISVSVVSGPPEGEQLVKAKAAWEKALAPIVQKENATMFMDVGISLNWPAPNTSYGQNRGIATMRALACSTSLVWKQIDGVQIFGHFPRTERDANASDDLLRAIQSLPAAQRTALVEGTLPLSHLSPEAREAFEGTLGDPDLHFVFLSRENITSLRLLPVPIIRPFKSKSTAVLPLLNPSILKEETKSLGKQALPPIEKLERTQWGPLDFGKGKILSLQEIVERASMAFNKRYSVTKPTNQYYVAGRFSKRAFESTLEMLTTDRSKDINSANAVTPPTQNQTETQTSERHSQLVAELLGSDLKSFTTQTHIDLTWLRDNISFSDEETRQAFYKTYDLFESMPRQEFLQKSTVDVTTLGQKRPGLAATLKEAGFELTDEVQLDVGLILVARAPGKHLMSHFVSPQDIYSPVQSTSNQAIIPLFN